MAQSYTRQSSFSDGDTITAALFNNEYNQLVNAFTYSSSSASSTGHRHDGTAGHGGNIHTIGDLDFLNKIMVSSNTWEFYVEVSSAAAKQMILQDGALVPNADSDLDLGTSSVYFKNAYIDSITTTGAITSSSTVQGTTITATTAFVPDASDGAALGTSSLEFSDLFLADGAVINFGDDQDVSLTHVADTGLLLSSTDQLQFGDSGTYIYQSADGVLDLVADTEIEINATTIDINGAADVSGNLAVGGNLTVTGNATIAGNLTFGDAASDTVAFSADVASNLLPSADNTYDIGASGSEWKDLYIDGTANIDSLVADTADINGGTVDGAIIGGSSAAAITGTAITGTSFVIGSADISEAELETIDGVTAGTVAASKAVVVDSNKDIGSFRNITLTGELDAATLDISGDADIDGTLEADAITIGGTTLAETISDTVGAMVSSNTETGITVTYEDGDNTLDFAIGTLNQDTTGTADNITVSANNSADETVYPIFVDGATGSQGAESDTGLTYNPSSGVLTSTSFTGNLTGNVTGNTSGTAATVTGAAQSNITSLGTLTTLTVDNVIVNGTTIGHTSDTDLITLADGNVTIAGELDLTTLDVSGDADIDGTLEADAITIGGTTLAEFISDTAGAMFSSNTETGITATYQDADNTIDLVVGTLNQDTTGTASKVTVSDSTANTNFPVVFHDESNALLDDTGALRYNPSTGELLVPKLTVAGTTTTADTVTMEASNAIIFEGATADSNETTLSIVDPTSDHTQYLINQGGYIPVLAAATTTAITATPAELNLLDTAAANSVVNSKAVIYGSSGELAGTLSTAAQANITSVGTLTGLTVGGASGATITMNDTDGSEQDFAFVLGANALAMRKTSNSNDIMRLDLTNERVGIGTASPDCLVEMTGAHTSSIGMLHLDSTDHAFIALDAAGATNDKGIYFQEAGTSQVIIDHDGSANQLRIHDGSSTHMVITDAGLVGIGTTSPSTNLHVYSTADNAPHLLLENYQNADTDDAAVIELYLNDQTTGGIGDDTDVGVIRFTGDEKDGGTKETYAEIRGVAHDPGQGSANKGHISFFVQAAGDLNETLTLDEAKVGINQVAPSADLHITGSGDTKIIIEDGSDEQSITGHSGGLNYAVVAGDAHTFVIDGADKAGISANGMGIGNVAGPGGMHSGVQRLVVGDGAGNEGMAIWSGADSSGMLGFARANAGNSDAYDGSIEYEQGGRSLRFAVNAGAERGRFTSNGLFIGTTTATVTSNTLGHYFDKDGYANHRRNSAPSLYLNRYGTEGNIQIFYHAGTGVGSISVSNDATAFNTSSDYRLKNVKGSIQNGLERTLALNPVEFEWKESGKTSEGFIAHEAEEIFADAVSGEKDGKEMQGMDYGRITPLLVKAIQEQQEQIEELKQQINKLKEEK